MSLPRRADTLAELPGSIRAVIPNPVGGFIIMSGFPGLDSTIDGTATFLPDACRETLTGIRALGAERLTVLVERDELDATFFPMLEEVSRDCGLGLESFPIVDYSVPSPEASAAWHQGAPMRATHFAAGGTIAFCCQYGAGRSGLMAALCLLEAGFGADDAIAQVRGHFSEAIESDEQEKWLRDRG